MSSISHRSIRRRRRPLRRRRPYRPGRPATFDVVIGRNILPEIVCVSRADPDHPLVVVVVPILRLHCRAFST